MAQNANDLLMSGGIKSAKFDTLGDTVMGTLVDEPKAIQMTKYQSDELDFWPSGDPKMQIVVTIQTDLRDPADAFDEGKRRLHIPPRMMPPVREAVQRAGAKGLAIGGRIAVRWITGTGKGEGNPKVYAAEYQAPAVDPGGLLTGGGNGHQPATAQAPAAAAPAPQPSPMLATPTQAAPATARQGSMLAQPTTPAGPPPAPHGVDPTVWAGLPDAQRQAVLAAMSNPAATAAPF